MKTPRWCALSVLFLLCLSQGGYGQDKAGSPPKGTVENSGPQPGANSGGPRAAAPSNPAAASTTAAGSKTEVTGPRVEGVPPGASELPPTVPAGRPPVVLVLEGGGALGLAHIGVLKWMEENHVPVDRIAGTSMGALVGALYATGRSASEVAALANNSDFSEVFTFETPYTDISFRRRQDRREMPQGIEVGLRNGVSIRNALLTDRGLDGFLHANFVGYNTTNLDFNRLPTPFRCVATDLNDLQMVVFAGGPLGTALRASISIPGVFPPVLYRGHYLVDGAIVDNLPTDVARDDLKAGVIIAVHLDNTSFQQGDVDSIVGVFARAFTAGTARNERLGARLATILLNPATAGFSTTDYKKTEELIEAGYQAAEEKRTELLKYALNDADWAAYVQDRNSRRHAAPGLFKTLEVEGGSPGARAKAERDLAPLEGQPIDQDKIFTALTRVQSNGSYNAGFETFSPAQKTDPGSPLAPGPDTGVVVRLSQVRNGPPFLILGADLSAMNSNVTRGTFDARLVDQNLGGFGSELRADARLGFLTQASAEYYRLLNHEGLFLQPHLGVIREPVYLWTNQVRTSELLQQEAGGGLDFGRTFNRNTQLSAEWRAQVVRWHLVLGQDYQPDISGSSQTAVMHLAYDNRESGTISPHGLHLDVSAGSLFRTVASENAPLVQLRLEKTTTLGEKNIFGFSMEGNTYFRRNVTEPLRFTLGGPLRLSASSINEYRGTDDYFVQGGYLRRLAALPSGLGQGLYLTGIYEAGEMWSPETPAFLREDFAAGVVAATPLGVITFGASAGDAGRRKVFFTLGRYF